MQTWTTSGFAFAFVFFCSSICFAFALHESQVFKRFPNLVIVNSSINLLHRQREHNSISFSVELIFVVIYHSLNHKNNFIPFLIIGLYTDFNYRRSDFDNSISFNNSNGFSQN